MINGKTKQHFIKSFEIKNFRGIVNSGKIEIPACTQWVFLTGENGYGKTSVLQALAVGLYGKENVNALSSEERDNAKITVCLQDDKIFRGYPKKVFKNVMTYGADRLKRDSKSSNQPTDSLFNKETYFLPMDDILIQFMLQIQEEKYKEAFQELQNIFCKIIPDLDSISMSEGTLKEVLYKERFSENLLPYDALSTGFRSWITLIGDIISRYYQFNHIDSISKMEWIVLIDEFDLHLHPKWQQKLPKVLSEIFPNIQFIVSTHSPIPLLGAPEKAVFLKVVRIKEEGIKIQNLDYVKVRNLTPNTILTSPIFDYDEFIPENENDFLNQSVEDLYKEEVFNQILNQKLQKMSKEEENLLEELIK
ncbi:MAG: AAA family ATPase [Leptospiraceae bacterium]|nr:AAA family ATPase [Leptospiraceae bacterium]